MMTPTALESHVNAFVTDIADLIKQATIQRVADALGAPAAGTNGAAFAKPARARSNGKASKPAARKPARARGGKRSEAEIAATVAKVLGYVKKHPGQRSEHVRAALGMLRPTMTDAIRRLVAEKKIRTKGEKRATEFFPR